MEDFEKWADICVTEVIDACHFWAHVGGKRVTEKIEGITQRLLSEVNFVIYQLFTVISLSFFNFHLVCIAINPLVVGTHSVAN